MIGSFFSFEGETVVEAIEGQKKIRDIAVGDLVASRDAFTGEKTFRPVTDLFRRTAPGIVHVTLDGPDGKRERLDVTSEHPLFAEGKGWTQVRRLQKGDRVLSGKGGPLAVADIVHDNTPTLVYNFEVAQDHSYFAGREGAWSHNACHKHHVIPCQVLKQLPDAVRRLVYRGNIVQLDEAFHRWLHSGKGCGRGGQYNKFFWDRIKDIENITPEQLRRIAADARRVFGF